MASHHSKSLYAIKECSTCGRLYTRECCSIGNLEDKILVPVPDSSPRCARCGTPVDGPSCRGCAFLRKKFDEDLLTYCVENGIFQDFQNTSESSDDNTNVVNALREPCVVNQDPGVKFSSEKIDEEYERDCEIRIRKLKQDFNIWGSEIRKKEQAYEEEKYSAACRYMLSITCDDKDDYIPSGDIIVRYSTSKHLDTIPATELDEVIKSSVENLVPIPSEFEVISDDTCDVPNCDNNRINIESELVETLSNRDTLIVYSSKIDPIIEEFAGELTHIAPIPPGIVEADLSKYDISSDDDSFENIEYVDSNHLPFQSSIVWRRKMMIKKKKNNPTPGRVFESPSPFPIPVADSDSSEISLSFSDNSLPEFKSFSDHTEETRSGSTTTHANYSLPEYESFHFDNPSLPRPPSEPLDVCLDMLYNDESFEPGEGENIVVSNVEEDDSFTFTSVAFQF
ncbi:hypothetical protein Tco_0246903 [Tanacetum coccineum]